LINPEVLFVGAMASAALSEYEMERNARIESNKRLMESLGLNSDVAALKRAAGKPAIVFRAPFDRRLRTNTDRGARWER